MSPSLIFIKLDPLGQLHNRDVVDELCRAVNLWPKLTEHSFYYIVLWKIPEKFNQPEFWMRGDANDGDQDLSGVLAIPRVVAHADEDDTGLVVPRKDIDIVRLT